MTPEDRQALRGKHKCCPCGYCQSDECEAGCVGVYPCDTIKILDAWEAEQVRVKQTLDIMSTTANTGVAIYAKIIRQILDNKEQ